MSTSIKLVLLLVIACPLLTHGKPTTTQAAIQRVHQSIVPHTDARGAILTKYDAQRSFLTIGLWGQVLPDAAGGPYPSWKEVAAAGFNTVWPLNWDDRALDFAEEGKIQLVYMGSIDDAHAK